MLNTETMDDSQYDEVVSLLRNGGIIAFPTDTAYGLGCDPFNEGSVNRIFTVKGRAETKPILLLVNSISMAEFVSQPTDIFYRVANRFWPGPLTIISRAAVSLPENVTAGTKTIGIRWPVAAFATTVAARLGKPITGTSANRSGAPSAVTAEEVRGQIGDSVDVLVDGGVLPSRGGSTLLDLTVDPPALLREGPVTFDALSQFFGGRIRRQVA
jgi:L-threonylcarbamoyladenylate synthase